ncbi:hypothetical protein A5685_12355 [Mycobacterium colombiense]|uniref:Uncharacterized protein n=2 Tax=Mycobacterium colombiense TaxID=339268 RepID=A0A1A2RQS2_9MYCO|nr:hypothetical protein A5685_12355 [Mycobacterium colombiense]
MVEKIAAAPAYQLRKFLDDIASPDLMDFSPALPSMERGTLRPLVSGNPIEFVPNDNVSVALRLLLYTQEVALECDFIADMLWLRGNPVDQHARDLMRDVLAKLADLRPFIHQGIVHLTPVRSPAVHPSTSKWEYEAVKQPGVRDLVFQLLVENQRLTGEFIPEDEITDGILAAVLTSFYGATKIALHRMSEGTANPLTRTRAERELLDALLARGELPDRRRPLVDTLARLSVPDFRGDPKMLVHLRNSDEQFGIWRDKLGHALDLVGDMPENANLEEASDIVRTELESALSGLRKSVTQSLALRSAKNGVVQFGVGAVGAAVSASAISGSPTAGLITGASTQALNTVISYIKELRARRSDRLVLALAASFDASA